MPRHYPDVLKEVAVGRVLREGHPVARVCVELNVKPGSLYLWLRKHEVTGRPSSTSHYRSLLQENTRLRIELRRLQQEHERLLVAARLQDRLPGV